MNQFARPGLAVTQLPSFNENDKGKVLTINSESGALGWEEGSGGGSSFPSTETASAGDVLSLDDNKEPQWATPSGGGGVLVVHDVEGTLDKTWQEIYDAIGNGSIPIVTGIPSSMQAYITILGSVMGAMPPTMKYCVYSIVANPMMDDPLYVADTASDYPVEYTG